MKERLTTKSKWETVWEGTKLPAITKPQYDLEKLIKSHFPRTNEYSLIEIGCAPGRWMAYFNKNFNYCVTGVEYAEVAAAATKKNMELQGIDAAVMVEDFFTCDFSKKQYDIVFSIGFIEHFRDINSVVERICGLSRRYVITIVPNLYGLNGVIQKRIFPKIYVEHIPIDVPMLEELHKKCGLKTLFCDSVGGFQIQIPLRNYDFFRKHNYIRRTITGPITVFNHISMLILKIFDCTPRFRLLAPSLMYIGEKSED